jgi:hypothetical protein
MRRLGWGLALLCWASGCFGQERLNNVALGHLYTLSPQPNYRYCSDPEDSLQLTDGVYTQGHFWTQKSTVGWAGGGTKYITIDLGRVRPLCGLAFNTAAGVAEVRWPRCIVVFVSDDGQNWHEVGDLIKLGAPEGLPPYGTYAVVKLATTKLRAHGRYVQLAIEPQGQYCFVDEIEVYEGPPELLGEALPGEPIRDVASYMRGTAMTDFIQQQLQRDLQAAREDLQAPEVAAGQRAALAARADELAAAIERLPRVSPEGFRAVLPMVRLERDIFAFQAQVWRAQGKPPLRVWSCHRWDYLAPSDEPGERAPQPSLTVRLMNGEVRAEVLNFTNAAPDELHLRLRLTGLPGGTSPDYVTVRQVLHVGTRHFKSVAAALPEAPSEVREGVKEYLVAVPSGMTVQVWFEFQPQNLRPGRYEGAVVVQGAGETVRVPVRLIISRLRFPAQTSLLLGGWCYTDGEGAYGVTPQNRAAFIAYLRAHCVNVPWARPATLPAGAFDEAGRMVQPPDTQRFDEWVTKWRGARQYMVFLSEDDRFAGAQAGTEQFALRVGQWAHFWAQHMRALGLQPGQLGFLVADEPHDANGYRINAEWARAIQAAEPEFVLFVDPIPPQPDEGLAAMIEQMDVLCPQRLHWLTMDWVKAYYLQWQAKGKELWLYSCSGPTRSFDPYLYYLLQEWHCFAIGAKGSAFWAFGDTGGVSPWNDYVGGGAGPYCPMYLDETSVTTAKWMEAIREGVEDYEYLLMLQRRIGELEAAGQQAPARAAREVLQRGVERVLMAQQEARMTWDRPVDHSVADQVRYQVLDLLERL